jgi:hypothetical protein
MKMNIVALMVAIVFLLLVIGVLPCLLPILLTSGISQEAIIQDVCNRMWTDEGYRKTMEHGGYKKIGSYDHVLIWVDDANGAIFFDTADSLSAGGVVCFKEGAHPPVDEGVVAGRHVGHIEDNLYWWY